MDSENSSHYRGRKRKTGGRGRQKAEEAEAVPFQAPLFVTIPSIFVVAASVFLAAQAQWRKPKPSPIVAGGEVANIYMSVVPANIQPSSYTLHTISIYSRD
jgi:hypothetical protein